MSRPVAPLFFVLLFFACRPSEPPPSAPPPPPREETTDGTDISSYVDEDFLLEAARKRGITVDDEEVDQAVERLIQEKYGSKEAFLQALERQGSSMEEARRQVRLLKVIEKLEATFDPSPAEVKQYVEAEGGGISKEEAKRTLRQQKLFVWYQRQQQSRPRESYLETP